MSKTEKRNGGIVENGVMVVARSVWHGIFTVGEVARYTQMSKPTVKKYLDIMVEHGMLERMPRDMRYCAHNTPHQYRLPLGGE